MEKIRLILITLILLVIAGCSTNTDITPPQEDKIVKIEYDTYGGFVAIEHAFMNITIDEEGLLFQTYSGFGNLTFSEYTKFEFEEFEKLVKVLEDNDAKNLQDRYESDILVADAGSSKITIHYKNSTKVIVIEPNIYEGNPDEIKNINEAIQKLLVNANSPFNGNNNVDLVYLSYQGMQCVDEPWEVWYAKGEIQFIKAPTTKELIFAYYSSKNIDIINLEQFSNEAVCQACEVCPDINYFEIEVDSLFLEELIEEGWIITS